MSRIDLGPAPLMAFMAGPLDRRADLRGDPAALHLLERMPEARFLAVAEDQIILRRDGEALSALFDRAQLGALGEAREKLFLGVGAAGPWFGLGFDPAGMDALAIDPTLLVTDLRTIMLKRLLPPDEMSALAIAKAMLHWHARHRYCSACGTPSTPVEAGWRRDCPACATQHFPRTDPVVIMLIVDGDNCLLARQPRFPEGMWSCLAGFVEPGETLEAAVARETVEEVGIAVDLVRYAGSQPWPFPMSLMFAAFARASSRDIRIDDKELEAASWVSRAEARQFLERNHPQGVWGPQPAAVAHHLIRAFVTRGQAVFDEPLVV